MTKAQSVIEQRAVSAWTKTIGSLHAWLYQKSDGRIGSRYTGGAPVMLLTTLGRRSGKLRTSPLLYLLDGERLITVAANGGQPQHPAWYLNLAANPLVEVQLGQVKRRMHAATGTPELKRRYWPRLIAVCPAYQSWQMRTDRDLPVVVLTPCDP